MSYEFEKLNDISNGKSGTTHKEVPKSNEKHFKTYIICQEPPHEVGIVYINGVNILSKGNVMVVQGPPKSRKTTFVSHLMNESKCKGAWADTEQGMMHSWRLSQRMPTTDVFHLRGQEFQEITRVVNDIASCGEYDLLVIDNVRDLITDFNDVGQSARIELLLKQISEHLPVICILHENKNSKTAQGHLGHSLNKIAQTTIRVQLADAEDPGKGSTVQCVVSRDEPFRQCLFTHDGRLTSETMFSSNGKSMLMEDILLAVGGHEYTRKELNETFADLFDISEGTAANVLTSIRRAHPGVITERKQGKTKIFNVSLTLK